MPAAWWWHVVLKCGKVGTAGERRDREAQIGIRILATSVPSTLEPGAS